MQPQFRFRQSSTINADGALSWADEIRAKYPLPAGRIQYSRRCRELGIRICLRYLVIVRRASPNP